MIDGANFSTMDGLFREFNRLFDVGPDEAVHSLDALNDLLGGGIGKIPAGARLHIRWLNSEKSREDFGYGATVISCAAATRTTARAWRRCLPKRAGARVKRSLKSSPRSSPAPTRGMTAHFLWNKITNITKAPSAIDGIQELSIPAGAFLFHGVRKINF